MTRDSNTLRRFWHLIALAAVLALVIPAIPFLLLGLVVWAFMRKTPATA